MKILIKSVFVNFNFHKHNIDNPVLYTIHVNIFVDMNLYTNESYLVLILTLHYMAVLMDLAQILQEIFYNC